MINPALLDMHVQARLDDDRRYLQQAALTRALRDDAPPRRRWFPTLPALRGIRARRSRQGAPRTVAPQP